MRPSEIKEMKKRAFSDRVGALFRQEMEVVHNRGFRIPKNFEDKLRVGRNLLVEMTVEQWNKGTGSIRYTLYGLPPFKNFEWGEEIALKAAGSQERLDEWLNFPIEHYADSERQTPIPVNFISVEGDWETGDLGEPIVHWENWVKSEDPC